MKNEENKFYGLSFFLSLHSSRLLKNKILLLHGLHQKVDFLKIRDESGGGDERVLALNDCYNLQKVVVTSATLSLPFLSAQINAYRAWRHYAHLDHLSKLFEYYFAAVRADEHMPFYF
jgi:hypothetical protein